MKKVKLSLIDDNPHNPRGYYSPEKVEELAYSIHQHGMRQIPEARQLDNGRYQLAFGHFRKRAFSKLNNQYPELYQDEMPLDVKEITDEQMMYFALEENLRRKDLKPLDIARCIQKFIEVNPDTKITKLAKKLNMSQGHVSNMLRVLDCPAFILEKVEDGRLSYTMARELLSLEGKQGFTRDYDYKTNTYLEKTIDSSELMKNALKHITGNAYPQYKQTVEGIRQAIDSVADNYMQPLTGSRETIFNPKEEACLLCPDTFKTQPSAQQEKLYCTNRECFRKKLEAFKKKQGEEVKNKIEAEILKKATETIPQGIPPDQEAGVVPENKEDKGQPAAAEIPAEVLEKAKGEMGTRAEVLDLAEIGTGGYYLGSLKEGYTYVSPNDDIKGIDECLKNCNRGFHYAYNRNFPDRKVEAVCSDPECYQRKKNAFSREKNAVGRARLAAEKAAFKKAVDATTNIDEPRLKLIALAILKGNVSFKRDMYSREEVIERLLKKLAPDPEKYQEGDLVKKVMSLKEEELAKILVDIFLEAMRDHAPMTEYKIRTTEALNLLGIGINIEPAQKSKEVEAAVV